MSCIGASLPPGPVEEVLAMIRGEEVTVRIVELAIGWIDNRNLLSLPKTKDVLYPLVCADGTKITEYTLGTLKRNFQYIDDFLSDFPDAESVIVPYPRDVVLDAISGIVNVSAHDIRTCVDCIRYLNPKDNLYYFRFDLEDVEMSVILELYSKLTAENRRDILEARRFSGTDYPLPDEGLGIGIMGAIFEANYTHGPRKLLFADFPSYLALSLSDDTDYLDNLLLTNNFQNQNEFSPFVNTDQISTRISRLLSIPRPWPEVQHLLAMMEVKYSWLGNDKMKVYLPYRAVKRDKIFRAAGIAKIISASHPGGMTSEEVLALM
jgi:hypothetical protein